MSKNRFRDVMVIFGLFTATVVVRSASACNRACCPLMSEALPHASPRFFIMAFPRQLSGSHANDAAHSLADPSDPQSSSDQGEIDRSVGGRVQFTEKKQCYAVIASLLSSLARSRMWPARRRPAGAAGARIICRTKSWTDGRTDGRREGLTAVHPMPTT